MNDKRLSIGYVCIFLINMFIYKYINIYTCIYTYTIKPTYVYTYTYLRIILTKRVIYFCVNKIDSWRRSTYLVRSLVSFITVNHYVHISFLNTYINRGQFTRSCRSFSSNKNRTFRSLLFYIFDAGCIEFLNYVCILYMYIYIPCMIYNYTHTHTRIHKNIYLHTHKYNRFLSSRFVSIRKSSRLL